MTVGSSVSPYMIPASTFVRRLWFSIGKIGSVTAPKPVKHVDSLGVRKAALGALEVGHETVRAEKARKPEPESQHAHDRRERRAPGVPQSQR